MKCGGYYKGHIMLHTILGHLRVTDVGGSFRHHYETWIGYQTCVRSDLMDLHQDSPLTLRHGLWPQSCVDVRALRARLLDNEKVREELDQEDHYIGHASNHSHHLSMLQWIVVKVICSYCVLEMRHMLDRFKQQELCLNQVL